METNGCNKTNGKYHQKHLTLSSGKRRLLGDVSTEGRRFSFILSHISQIGVCHNNWKKKYSNTFLWFLQLSKISNSFHSIYLQLLLGQVIFCNLVPKLKMLSGCFVNL